MAKNKICRIEQLIAQLIAEGWKMQRDGMVYISGTLATNLYKDGEVISLSQEFYPDDEMIADLWQRKK